MNRIAYLALALSLPVTAAFAQGTPPVSNGTQFGDWMIQCQAIGVQQTQCSLVQELTLSETGALVARVLVTELQGGPAIVGHVPIGAYLPSGVAYHVVGDDTPQREMIWQRCLGSICEGALALDDAEIERLSEGTMRFGYRPAPGADPVVVNIQLDGFAEGVAAMFGGN